MNPTVIAARAGLLRGWIETRQTFTNGQDLFGQFIWPVLTLGALFFMRDGAFEASGLTLGALALPSVVGMMIAFNGMFAMAGYLAMDREDGTLLRAKATPNGMVGYLVGKIAVSSASVLIQVAVILGVGSIIVGGVHLDGAGSLFTLLWVLALGLLAVLPMGAALGSLFDSPRSIGFMAFPIMGLVAISGIFYPITAMPGWLQGVAQLFPIYWLGLGMRSALLPDSAAAVELGGSWRTLETAAVLGLWAVAGLVLAPILLRRMARRESGSSVAARREKAIQRGY
ncbi:ABC transporter permease [Nocardia sp. NPDC003693]